MATVSNEFQLRISNVADGTRPASSFGTSITPGNNSYGSYTQLLSATSDDAYEVWVCVSGVGVSAAAHSSMVTIGVDTAGGTTYTDLIPDLVCGPAGAFAGTAGEGGVWFRFPLFIPAGSTVAAKGSRSNGTSAFQVLVVLHCQPTHPELLRCGTFVRAFGASVSTSQGTSITAGTTSEGSYTSLGTISDSELWYWEVGFGSDSSTIGLNRYHVDLQLDTRQVIRNAPFFMYTTEEVEKPLLGWYGTGVNGEDVEARVQVGPNVASASLTVAAYGVGGDALSPLPSGGGDTDPPTPIYGGYPSSLVEIADAVGFDTTWVRGWLCDETSSNLEDISEGESLVPGTPSPTYNLDGFLAGADRAIGFDTGSMQRFAYGDTGNEPGGVGETDDLVLALVLKLRPTESEGDIARFGDGNLSVGAGWHLTYDGTSLKFLVRDEDGPDEASVSVDMTGAEGRWFVVLVALDRASDTLRMAVAIDPGTGLVSVADGTIGNVEDIGNAIDAAAFTLGSGIDDTPSAGFECSALYVGSGSGVAGTVNTSITAAVENLYLAIMQGEAVSSGDPGDVIITAFPDFTTDDATPTFAFTATGYAEFSLDGGDFEPATSPLALGPLLDGPHTLVIRLVDDHDVLQAISWDQDTGNAVIVDPPVPIPAPLQPHDEGYTDHVELALARLPYQLTRIP
jgi:hypothetical protein